MTRSSALRYSGWTLLFAVIALVIAGAALTIRSTERTSEAETNEELQSELIESLQELIDEDEVEQAQAPRGARTATLESQRDKGEEFGVVVTSFSAPKNVFELELFAQVSDPQPGGSYVLKASRSDEVLELGTLIKDVENGYFFTLSQSESLEDISRITVEEVNGSDRSLVLEGIFE